MMGLEMPLPVVICATPGCLAMASMMFVEVVCRNSLPETMEIGAVEFFSFVSPVTPVTTSSLSFR